MATQKAQQKVLDKVKNKRGERSFAALYSAIACGVKQREKKNIFFLEVPSNHLKSKIEEDLVFLKEAAKEEGFDGVEVVVNKKMKLSVDSEEVVKDNKSKKDNTDNFQGYEMRSGSVQDTLAETKAAIQDTKKTLKKTDFTFENFITGPTNDFAVSVAVGVSNNLGTAYNPFLIYGPVGLGKTHLLKAIGHQVLEQNSRAKVLYLTAEQLLNAFTYAIREKKTKEFQTLTRTQDVILIDDIQFFSGKFGFQEEMHHIFNVLENEEKQMVFTSDKPIAQIKDLESRLVSRFQSGMSADLQPPTVEMAMSILQNYLLKNKTDLVTQEQLYFISENVRSNTRDMLGFLMRLVEYSKMTKKQVPLETMQKWMHDTKARVSHSDFNKILKATARHFTVSMEDLKSKKRTRNISQARHVAMYLIRKHVNLSFTQVGDIFNVSHVSANRAYSSAEEDIKVGAGAARDIGTIEASL